MNGHLSTTTATRPSSEQVRDLHVYVIPPELWRQHLRSAANEVITDSISLGFLRIEPHIHLYDLRQEIKAQLGDDYLPKDYAFLKSVGRCLTQVKSRQERELKVKHFLPPYAYAPELYILDAHAESMRDSPSTIFQHSLSGTGLSKSGSKAESAKDYSGDRTTSKYQHGTATPGSSGAPTYRVAPHSGAEDNPYNSQVFDQPTNSSSYPTYSHPYSHDISALTNAHRNQVDSSQNFDTYNNRGGDTYRKYNDDSSGYKSMPSPKKLSESPPRLYNGDGSMAKKLNQGSSNHSPQISHSSQQRESRRSPSPAYHQDDRYQKSSLSPERHNERSLSNNSSPERHKGHPDVRSRVNGSGRNWADSVDDNSPSDYDKQTAHREMMSATPNGSPNRQQISVNSMRRTDKEDQSGDVPEREDYHSSNTTHTKGNFSTNEQDASSEQKQELLRQLQEAREDRLHSEKKREELVKKARTMQAKTNNRRNQAREVWKKKYYDAKKHTPGLETDCQKLRTQLDALHKKYLSALENSYPGDKQKENYQLEAAKLQYEVDELQRKADAAKMKLTAEMKLRNQAETELRALRAELTQKKTNMNLSRAQKINSIGNSVLSVSSQP